MPRFFVNFPLRAGEYELPERAARHVQVLRLQPGEEITVFDGAGGEWRAVITDMRKRVAVQVQTHQSIEREALRNITLAVGMPANDNMDWLVEKATELGVAEIQPLLCERSVLRLKGERAEKKLAHWLAVAQSACEQCGRNRVPVIHTVKNFSDWLSAPSSPQATRFVLSTREGVSLKADTQHTKSIALLSGPEGGLSPAEEAVAIHNGFAPITLGPRILRAETAPLVALAWLNTNTE